MTTRHPQPRSVSCVVRLFTFLTTFFPATYRDRHRADAIALMERLATDAYQRRGAGGVVMAAASAAIDLIWRLPAEHFSIRAFGGDVSYALRALRRRPLASAAAIATLAVGIGLNAAVFSIVDWVLVRPLPYPSPDDLVRVFTAGTSPVTPPAPVTYSEVASFSSTGVFRSAAAISTTTRILSGPSVDPGHIVVARVSGDLFGTLGVGPLTGRAFDARETTTGGAVLVISDGLWRNRFGADPTIAGRAVSLDGVQHVVVGVMPARAAYPANAEAWRPVTAAEREDDDRENVMIGRLSAGYSADRASRELDALAGAASRGARRAWAENMQRTEVRAVRAALTALLAAAGLVLLMAAANVAGLASARAADRSGELAVRAALGASRSRLLQQLVTESLLLAAVGGVAGLLLGAWSVRLLVAMAPAGLPRAAEIALDGRIVAIGAAVTLLVGVALGVITALRASRVDLRGGLESGSSRTSTASRRRGRRLFVALQTAVAVVLTVGAALLSRSLARLVALEHGFSADRLIAVELNVRNVPLATSSEIYRQLIETAEAVPGVRSAAIALRTPHQVPGPRVSVRIDGDAGKASTATVRPVSLRYFETAGIPLTAGRRFVETDTRSAARVAVVNTTFVRSVLGGRQPLGIRLRTDLFNGPIVIVGIAADVTPGGENDRPALYLSLGQMTIGGGSLIVRTAGDPRATLPVLTSRLRAAAPALALDRIGRVEVALESARAPSRFNAQLAAAFSVLALLLAAISVYGLTAGEVAARWRELAVRLALGATRAEALATVMRSAAAALVLGAACGIAAAIPAARSIRSLLHGIDPADPLTLAAVPIALIGIGLAASILAAAPILRADPAATLRRD